MCCSIVAGDDVRLPRCTVAAWHPTFRRCSIAAATGGAGAPDDERGTLNLIGPDQRIRAAALVQDGVTVSCALPINTVGDGDNTNPAVHAMIRAGDVADGETVRFTSDYLAVAPHGVAHSHLDALCHFFWQGQMYNGRPIGLVTSMGARANAITIGQDGIVSRGVLLDMPRHLGVDWLEPEHAIRWPSSRLPRRRRASASSTGDILLVRTGRHARKRGARGLGQSDRAGRATSRSAPWLHDRGVALLGCDGVTDVRDHPFTVTGSPMHILTLVAIGMQLLDNQNLDDLAVACRRAVALGLPARRSRH